MPQLRKYITLSARLYTQNIQAIGLLPRINV